MDSSTINLIEEINQLSQVHSLDRSDISNMMYEFAKRITPILKIEKFSVWMMNDDQDKIVSVGEFDLRDNSFEHNNVLLKALIPSYFKAILNNKILLVENVLNNPVTSILADSYFIPKGVISLMDIPMRMDGKLIGVVCFEKTGKKERIFSEEDQVFGLTLAMILSSTIEARFRRVLQAKLDKELREKEVLIKEIHHRVKNNLSVVKGLMSLQAAKAKDDYHLQLLNECQIKISSIAHIHNIVYQNGSFSEINVRAYFNTLLNELVQFFKKESLKLTLDSTKVESFEMPLESIMPLALLVNEVVTNCFKHAFLNQNEGEISIELRKIDSIIKLRIRDTGIGFDCSKKHESLGMEIINGLAEQLDATYLYCGDNGADFDLSFQLTSKN